MSRRSCHRPESCVNRLPLEVVWTCLRRTTGSATYARTRRASLPVGRRLGADTPVIVSGGYLCATVEYTQVRNLSDGRSTWPAAVRKWEKPHALADALHVAQPAGPHGLCVALCGGPHGLCAAPHARSHGPHVAPQGPRVAPQGSHVEPHVVPCAGRRVAADGRRQATGSMESVFEADGPMRPKELLSRFVLADA